DRRLVGRPNRARLWVRTDLGHHHRHHRRLHRRVAAHAVGIRAVLRLRRLDHQRRDRSRHTVGDRRLHQTLARIGAPARAADGERAKRKPGSSSTSGSVSARWRVINLDEQRAGAPLGGRLPACETRRSVSSDGYLLERPRSMLRRTMPKRSETPMSEASTGAARARDKPWIFRTYAGHSNARDSNALYRKNLAKGQTGLSVAFDLPTQTGYDSDHPLAKGEVGKVGVPISHLGDMRTLFERIPLGEMNTSMTINATAAWLLALYVALADEQGVARQKLQGTTQNDIIKEYLSRGTYVFPPTPSMR